MLKLSNDRKVSPVSKWAKAAERFEPEVPNAFGLPAGPEGSCPGATDLCRKVCYAAATERRYTSASKLVEHNLAELQAAGTVDGMVELLDNMIGRYIAACERIERLRKRSVQRLFRIHWDGDFFSVDYAEAWRIVMLRHPDVQFWAYTRSFVPACNVVPTLHDVPNLSLYLSVDAHNEAWANVMVNIYGVRLAVMADTFDDAQGRMVELRGKRAPKCPENARKVPLVNDKGEGACVTCGLCIFGRQDVLFSTSKG